MKYHLSINMGITAYVDAPFAVHLDLRSHTGVMISLGKCALYSRSSKQKLYKKSSHTEFEVIAATGAVVPAFLLCARISRVASLYLGKQRVDNNVSENRVAKDQDTSR